MDTENKDLINNIPEESESESVKEAGEEFASTLDIDKDDISFELERYGISEEEKVEEEAFEVEEAPAVKKKPFIIQKPIIIAAVSFLLVAVLVLGSVFVYNTFMKPGIDGVWNATTFGEGVFIIFDKSGNATIDNGVIKYIGTYELAEKEFDDSESGTKEYKQVIKSGVIAELFNELYGQQLMMYGMTVDFSKADFVVDVAEDGNTMSFTYMEYGIPIELSRTQLPERTIDPSVITHASADEVGLTELNVDSKIVGTWFDGQYSYFAFNSDGTGVTYIPEEDVLEQSGYSYRFEQQFTYTTKDGKIFITVSPYIGEKNYGEMPYSMDGDKLIIGTIGYTKVN